MADMYVEFIYIYICTCVCVHAFVRVYVRREVYKYILIYAYVCMEFYL